MNEPKRTSVIDRISWHWRNESSQMVLDKRDIVELFESIKELKERIEILEDDLKEEEKLPLKNPHPA